MTMRSFKSRHFKSILFISMLAGPTQGLFAQSPEILAEYKSKYPGEKVVQLKDVKTVTIKYVKNEPQISYHIEMEDLITDSKGVVGMNEEEIHFSSLETVSNIKAYTMVPNGSKFKKVASTESYTRDAINDDGIFHDDDRVTTVVFSGIQEGAVRHLSYDVTMHHNHFPFAYFFFNYYPGENARFEIVSDTSIHVLTQEYFLDKIQVEKSEQVVKNMRTLTYTCPNVFKIKDEDNAVSVRYYAPHVLAQIGYYNSKTDGRVQVGETLSDLHAKYFKNVKDVLEEIPSEELKETADSIIKDCKTEFDKVKAVYYWVQDNLKYVAFEEGLNGFIPRQPSRILEKRFGDCKDMASLIYSLLKAADIKSYLTWIGSRDIPYKYTEFPSTYVDNHMICAYKDENGKWYFLDATNSFQPISSPTYFIQGKEAMINIDENNFEIVTVPIMPASYTTVKDSSFIRIDERNLIGHTVNYLTGYYQSTLGNIYRDVPIKESNKFLTSMNERGNNSFHVTEGSYLHSKERDSTGILDFNWNVTNYCTKVDNEIYINMVLDKDISKQGEIKENRVSPTELPSYSSDDYCVTLDIPEGYTVKYLPQNVTFESDIVDLYIRYEQKGNKLILNLHLNLKYLYLFPKDFDLWNQYNQVKKKALNESVILIKQ